MMSKVDFELVAYALSVAKANDVVIDIMAITLDNNFQRFDKQKFIKACKEVRFR